MTQTQILEEQERAARARAAAMARSDWNQVFGLGFIVLLGLAGLYWGVKKR
jgi:hypothetical protein